LFAQVINLICVKKRVLKKNYCKNLQEEHIKGNGYISVVFITYCFRRLYPKRNYEFRNAIKQDFVRL